MDIFKSCKFEKFKEASTLMNQKENLCKEDRADKIDKGYFISVIDCLMYPTAAVLIFYML